MNPLRNIPARTCHSHWYPSFAGSPGRHHHLRCSRVAPFTSSASITTSARSFKSRSRFTPLDLGITAVGRTALGSCKHVPVSSPSIQLRTMASEQTKIRVRNPVVEMDGDEVSWLFVHCSFVVVAACADWRPLLAMEVDDEGDLARDQRRSKFDALLPSRFLLHPDPILMPSKALTGGW